MLPETFTFFEDSSLTLNASFYRSTTSSKDQTIIYLHGGGLIWGDRKDLPLEYISQFLKAGYHFLAIDYPLAPETALPEIYAAAAKAINWFSDQFISVLSLKTDDYFLFGRSAGAYLALLLAHDPALPKPKKILSFYGYHSVEESFYLSPSKHYQQYPTIPEKLKNQLVQSKPLVSGSLENRYAIYIYCRQTGKWLDVVMPQKRDRSQFSLLDTELKQLPPAFIAQSKQDQDVPYALGVHLANTIPYSKLFTVEKLTHDFDKDPTNPIAQQAYTEAIDWLNN
ncbi:alpha/beta hydrolase [Carnobacterium antarcticum]|uniref:Alpha/beta hydrolase n=1 Tax=Carnobacterium antarcticum TaxID=2126436 RepID=A0ABW4NIZ8_9LACT|nr:alpha/beta hydrolase [Carnobacterium sp. CP1]ALV21440.1 hypothetical protein NY10_825 [Carnobacterium sp. CP1]